MPPSKRQAHVVSFRVTEAEFRTLKAEAKRRGVSLTDLMMEPWRKTNTKRKG